MSSHFDSTRSAGAGQDSWHASRTSPADGWGANRWHLRQPHHYARQALTRNACHDGISAMQKVYCLCHLNHKPAGAALQQQEEDATVSTQMTSLAHILRCIRIHSEMLNITLGFIAHNARWPCTDEAHKTPYKGSVQQCCCCADNMHVTILPQ